MRSAYHDSYYTPGGVEGLCACWLAASAESSRLGFSFDGRTVTILPTREARRQIGWAVVACLASAPFVVVLAIAGVWPVAALFSLLLGFYAVMLWRMVVARLVLTPSGMVVRNMWGRTRLAGDEVASLVLQRRANTSLWTFGMDARWPFSWSPIVVGWIESCSGLVVEPDALRSRDEGV